jgi:hypothetical protein
LCEAEATKVDALGVRAGSPDLDIVFGRGPAGRPRLTAAVAA